MTKKGSLNLSINAIVVLILAITMLGLGLAFIQNMFGGTSDKLKNLVQGMDENVKVQLENSPDRITLSSTSFEVEKGSEEITFFAIRNDLDAESGLGKFMLQDFIYCDSAIGSGNPDDITFNTYEFENLNPGESKVLSMFIKSKSSAVSTIYRCHIDICNPDSASATTDVTTSKCAGNSYEILDFDLRVK